VFQTADDQIAKCEEISLDSLTDDQRERFKALIKSRLSGLQEEIRKMDWSFFERFRLQFIDVPRGLMMEKLKKLVGYEQ
jgi:hypothetical protein